MRDDVYYSLLKYCCTCRLLYKWCVDMLVLLFVQSTLSWCSCWCPSGTRVLHQVSRHFASLTVSEAAIWKTKGKLWEQIFINGPNEAMQPKHSRMMGRGPKSSEVMASHYPQKIRPGICRRESSLGKSSLHNEVKAFILKTRDLYQEPS